MQRNAEEGVPSSKGQFSSEEAVKEAPQTAEQRNSLRNQVDPSARMRNSSDPLTDPLDSSKSSSLRTEEALEVFAEEVKEMRKTMEFLRDSTGSPGTIGPPSVS
jgi:hypothetical protein